MNFIFLPQFVTKLKTLSKKYPALRKCLEDQLTLLELHTPKITPLGKDWFKVRLPIRQDEKEKNTGTRVIYCIKVIDHTMYFITMYDKAEQETTSDTDLKMFIDYIELPNS